MSTIAINLSTLLNETHLNATMLGKQISVDPSVITRIMKGETTNPNVNTLKKIASFFNVSISQLCGEEPLESERKSGEVSTKQESLLVPTISIERICNYLDGQIEPNTLDTCPVPLYLGSAEDLLGILVEDESLEPRFFSGTTIIINKAIQPKNNQMALIRTGDYTKLCKIVINGKETYLKSLNINLLNNAPELKTEEDHIIGTLVYNASTLI